MKLSKRDCSFLERWDLIPGIDHMSAMKMIDEIKKKGGTISSFKSHCGGLVSPESDDNPWHYKITWNPANVVMAGSSGAIYRDHGNVVTVPYCSIFNDDNHVVNVPALFPLAWYANRDSLSYIDTYHLNNVETFLRTTLRHPSFCRGWNKIISLDLTNANDHEEIKECNTILEWLNLKKKKQSSKIDDAFFNDEFVEQINYLGLQQEEKIPETVNNSASLLQFILEKKLPMMPHDKDMIVMLHEIEYSLNGKKKAMRSCLIVKGEDQLHTAMAKTVGLPLGIAANLMLQNKLPITGLHIPVLPEIYEPVLKELELNGIQFIDELQE